MKRIYLASPYTHESKSVMGRRFIAACRAAAMLMRAGNIVFSPIAHSHPISKHFLSLPPLDFWLEQDRAFVEWADEVYVLRLKGWGASLGVLSEIQWATEAGKPVVYL